MTRLKSPERVTLPQPIALMFRDVFDLALVKDGLSVKVSQLITVAGQVLRKQPCTLSVTPSGFWTVSRLTGVSGGTAGQDPDYLVEVEDKAGRYLPFATILTIIVADPAAPPPRPSAISRWDGWDGLVAETGLIQPSGPPPGYQPDYIPLFSKVARSSPSPRAEVRAHLMVRGAAPGTPERPAIGAVMTVSVKPEVNGVPVLENGAPQVIPVGLGIADQSGAVTVTFPYPDLPPAAQRSIFSWKVAAQVHFDDSAADEVSDLVNDQRDLRGVLNQLTGGPRPVFAQTGPDVPLGDQILTMGQPLILRTTSVGGEPSSYLYLQSA
jgi:hypothetical protein